MLERKNLVLHLLTKIFSAEIFQSEPETVTRKERQMENWFRSQSYIVLLVDSWKNIDKQIDFEYRQFLLLCLHEANFT